MSDTARFERMLFEYETTQKTDYRNVEIKDEVKTEYEEKPKCAMLRPAPLKYTHTMIDWTDGIVPPFDLLLQPKPITRTNPWKCQKPYKTPIDTERAEVQRTRPRLVMTPAACLDDVTDERIRNILIRYTYTSTLMQANQDIERTYLSVRAPFGIYPAPANVDQEQVWDIFPQCYKDIGGSMQLSRSPLPYVHPAWRQEMLEWENKQLRTYADPDRNFWLRQNTTCKECERTAVRREKQKQLAN